jgi:hypothetical protein
MGSPWLTEKFVGDVGAIRPIYPMASNYKKRFVICSACAVFRCKKFCRDDACFRSYRLGDTTEGA